MKEYLDDTEIATFYRVSVRTMLATLKRTGKYDGIVPKIVGGGKFRKYRMWSVEAIAKANGLPPERVVAAAVG